MRKKNLALVLTAMMVMSTVGQTTLVSAAEFTDEAVCESEAGEEFSDAEDVFDAEEETVFEDAAEVEAPAAEADGEHGAHYEGGYITQEEFSHWVETGEEPDFVQVAFYEELATPADLFAKLEETSENKTGFIMMSVTEEAEGFGEITAPEGCVVALAGGAGQYLKSLDGNFVARAEIFTPGTLKLEEGATLEICDTQVNGCIEGTKNNILGLTNWTRIGGLKNVQKVVYNSWNLETTGQAEFYEIENQTGHSMNISVEGYAANKIPVFHNNFDFGMERDEQGNEWPAGIGIDFPEKFDVPEGEDWTFTNPGEGAKIVEFAESLSEKDIFEMRDKMWMGGFDIGTGINMDGTVYFVEDQGRNIYDVEFMRNTDGMTAEQIFNNWCVDDIPEEATHWVANTTKLSEALRYVSFAQKYLDGTGYYKINLPWNAVVTETLTVPEGINGVMYEIKGDYNEATDEWKPCPAQVAKVSVPEGKVVKLSGIVNTTEKFKVSGEGTTIVCDCRFPQAAEAENLTSIRSTFKELTCENLTADQFTVVTNRLKAEKLEAKAADILVKSEAAVEIGTVEKHIGDGPLNFEMEVKNGKAAEIHFTGEMKHENEEFPEGAALWQLAYYDGVKALDAGAPFARDCFAPEYDFWGGETGYWEFMETIGNVKTPLMNISGAAASADWNLIGFYFDDGNLRAPADVASVGRHNLVQFEDKSETPVFIETGAAAIDISKAEIAAIKAQLYAGKAVTPTIKVTLNGKTLKKNVDYTVSYSNNTKAGRTAKVTVTGKGDYTGTISTTFKINAIPSNGKVYTIGNMKYKVTKAHYKTGEVSLYSVIKKTGTSISVPSTVKINGYTLKVTRIGASSLKNWTKLQKATIGSYVTSIGKNAFYNCKALKSITIKSSVLKSVESNALKGIYKKAVIKVPSKKLSTYQKLFKGKGQSSTVKVTK